jgi:tetratricopeptide (TPR) repeat protein
MKKFHCVTWMTLIFALLGWGPLGLRAAADDQAQFKRAQELEAQKNYAEAEAIYTRLLAANPTEPGLYTMRGWVRHLQKNESDALADLDKADAVKPKDQGILFRRGLVHKALDDSPNAVQDFAIVAAADPKNSRVRYELAYGLARSGRHREALKPISEAIALEPTRADYMMLRSAIHEKLGEGADALADAD